MDTLESMRIFLHVVDCGSFTGAADRLNTNAPYISRAIAGLENHLNTRLLHRTTRSIALTEAGQRYLLRCEQILSYVEEAEAEASDALSQPVGKLRLHAMPGLARHYIVGAIADYRAQNPMVSFELTLANRIPDLIEEGYDVSIIMAPELPDSSLISKRIGQTYSILCASPAYAEKYGLPDTPAQLEQHDCLRIDSTVLPLEDWELKGPDGTEIISIRQTPFQVNVGDTLRESIRLGMGIGMIPIFTAVSGLIDGSLIRVLPAYKAQAFNVYALYPSRMYLDAKTRTWVDFLSETIPEKLAADETAISQ